MKRRMSMPAIIAIVATGILGLPAGSARAAEPVESAGTQAPDEIARVRGFATLGISCFGSDAADYVYNTQPRGPGRTRRCDAGLDSLFGLQLDLPLAENWVGALQAVSQRRAQGDFRPEIHLANLRWQATDAWSLRAGRTSNPMFLHSDHRQVHYTLPGVRPTTEVYGQSPTFVMDGIDSSYRFELSGWRGEGSLGAHRNDLEAKAAGGTGVDTIALRRMRTATLTGERGPFLLKGGINTGRVTYIEPVTDALFDALRAFGQPETAMQLAMRRTRYRIAALALRYEGSDWWLQTEIAARRFDGSYFRGSEGAYLTVARRYALWMPYLTLARRKTHGPDSDPRTPAPLTPFVNALLASTRYDQRSLAVGASRDVGKGAVAKFEVRRIRPEPGAWGNALTNFAPDYDVNRPLRGVLISANLNFLF